MYPVPGASEATDDVEVPTAVGRRCIVATASAEIFADFDLISHLYQL